MISGRYRWGSLLRHFFPTNSGICELCNLEVETLEHILLPRCPVLHDRSTELLKYARDRLSANKTCSDIFEGVFSKNIEEETVQFLLEQER